MIKRGSLKMNVVSLILVVLLLNVAVFFINYGDFREGITGFSVESTVVDGYKEMSFGSKVFIIFEWVIMFFIVLLVIFKENASSMNPDSVLILPAKTYPLREQKTDLDILYDLLKEKKVLKLSGVAKAFNINENIAMGWAKILQTGNLAIIDYPFFGGAVIRIKE